MKFFPAPRRLLPLLFLVHGVVGVASTQRWPGTAPCNGTLQACINAATAGDTVEVNYYPPIDESLTISKSLTLRGLSSSSISAVPYTPSLAVDRGLLVQSPTTGGMDVTIENLVLLRGRVTVEHRSSGPTQARVHQLVFRDVDPIDGAAIRVLNNGTGPLYSYIEGNHVHLLPGSFGRNGIYMLGSASITLDAAVNGNRITFEYAGADPSANGIRLEAGSTAGSYIRTIGNRIGGNGYFAGVLVNTVGAGSFQSLLGSNLVAGSHGGGGAGIRVYRNAPNADVHVVNNTVVHANRGIDFVNFSSPASLTGDIRNNLIDDTTGEGLYVDPALGGGIGNDYNLLHATAATSTPLGANSLAVDPQFTALDDYRPRPGAPGINNGDTAAVPADLAFDAQGNHRVGHSAVDIGAFEAGTGTMVHVVRQPGSPLNTTRLVAPYLDGIANARIFAMPVGGYGEFVLTSPLGVERDAGSNWYLFSEDTGTSIVPGMRFNVTVPGSDSAVFVHVANAGTIPLGLEHTSVIDNAAINNQPDAHVFVTQNWDPPAGTTVYNNHVVGVYYASGRWRVFNEDFVSMPLGAAFNVMAAPIGSPNAFRHVVIAGVNTPPDAFTGISHPLLDNNPCAVVQATSTFDPNFIYDASVLTTGYDYFSRRWFLRHPSGVPMVAGAAYNVWIDEALSRTCEGDRIFADGLDG
ncbi:MAG: choice-of-anchor Q domain-containing protein [Dokdonella sp.]